MCDKSTGFVTTVVVDNKRAFMAYSKGMESLEKAWPVLVSHAAAVDKFNTDTYEARRREQEQYDLQYQSDLAMFEGLEKMYLEAYQAWDRRPLWRMFDPAPVNPTVERPLPKYVEGYGYPRTRRRQFGQAELDTIRSELQMNLDLAGAAVEPYTMTATQVARMILWEKGTLVGGLLEQVRQWT